MYRYTLERRKIIVTAQLKGPKGTFLYDFILDTGAGTTVISEYVANSLGYDLSKVSGTEILITAGGRVNSPMIQLHKMEMFGKSAINFNVCVIPLPLQILASANGLIGMDFLQKFRKLKIHFDTQEIETEL